MKNIARKVYQNRYFLLFIVLYSYVHSVYTRISVRQEINAYIFTPEAALASVPAAALLCLVILFFIGKWQRSETFRTQEMLKIFGTSLALYVLIMQGCGLFIAWVFDNIERNFNRETFVLSLFSDFLNGLIYGSFFLAYYYFQKNKKHQQQLSISQQALAESKINQLKAQLNPHFLFNNLNVLDQLIEEDKEKASDFLNEFSEIYRYVLKTSDQERVHVSEELAFAEQYFGLIRFKYGNAYQLRIENKNKNGCIVPLTLQLLIENAVQHNLGTEENPVFIEVNIDAHIRVSNNSRPKRNAKPVSGRALNNLAEQYKLLTREPMAIHRSAQTFSVTVPLIPSQEK